MKMGLSKGLMQQKNVYKFLATNLLKTFLNRKKTTSLKLFWLNKFTYLSDQDLNYAREKP